MVATVAAAAALLRCVTFNVAPNTICFFFGHTKMSSLLRQTFRLFPFVPFTVPCSSIPAQCKWVNCHILKVKNISNRIHSPPPVTRRPLPHLCRLSLSNELGLNEAATFAENANLDATLTLRSHARIVVQYVYISPTKFRVSFFLTIFCSGDTIASFRLCVKKEDRLVCKFYILSPAF